MIIRDKMGATLLIDARHAADENAFNEAASRIARQIVLGGEEFGAFIRTESVWFSRRPDPARYGVLLEGLWAPDPTEGVILNGGPLDGVDDASAPRGEDGLPPLLLSAPTGADTAEGRRLAADYTRAGIDSERDRWVYEFTSMG